MSHERTGLVNIEQRHIDEATRIAERFPNFTGGCRVLFLIQRHSDGGHTNNSKLRSYISRNSEEWIKCLAKLLQEMEFYPEIPLRIYQTINTRNVDKGIREFKKASLDADYLDDNSRQWFYLDVRNRIISAIMQRRCRESGYFLYDCDTKDEGIMTKIRWALSELTTILEDYPSKNGYHIITKPFNHTLIRLPEEITMSPDAMMLLKWK